MVYEFIAALMAPLLIAGAAGVSTEMPAYEPEYVLQGTSIIQVPESDGTIYWRYLVSDARGQNMIMALDAERAEQMRAQGRTVTPDYTVTLYGDEKTTKPEYAHLIQRLPAYAGYNGTGTTVAIIDSGVDFSNTDIRHSLARDERGFPIMLDADGQGIVITNATFKADIDEYGRLKNQNSVPENATSVVYMSGNGVFLDTNRGGEGTVVTVYNGLYPYNFMMPTFNATVFNDMKIGENSRDFIISKSGTYRLGFLYQPGPDFETYHKVQVVPMLVVDSQTAGKYDTIIPDMSTSWMDYNNQTTRGIIGYDFDFTDERPIRLGEGDEFLVYDADGDGTDDYTAGTLGARVVDVFGIIGGNKSALFGIGAVNGTLLPAMDIDGEFFGVMSDSHGHGSMCAATIASSGERGYDIYDNGTEYSIRGVAPGASILPVKSLWSGNTLYGALWSAGFDSTADGWDYSGEPRAEIVSSSWGIPAFPVTGSAAGLDEMSMLYGAVALPGSLHQDHPGTVMISSSGNDGHGYGSIATPSASSFVMAVGATTSNVYIGSDDVSGELLFGNKTHDGGDIAYFSSRGPSIIGDPKPNILATGAYAFVPYSVTEPPTSERRDDFTLFGGTSMAAPVVAGSAAVVNEAILNNGGQYDPLLIKNILASAADDTGNDPFVQGAGIVNVSRATGFLKGDNGSFIVYNDASYQNLARILAPAYGSINLTEYGLSRVQLPDRPMQMYDWFAGHVYPKETSSAVFTVENPSERAHTVTVTPVHYTLIQSSSYGGTTSTHLKDPTSKVENIFVPQYVLLSDVHKHSKLADYFAPVGIPENADLLALNLRFAFEDFMNRTETKYADKTQSVSLYLYDWNDENSDALISSDELSMINRGSLWGNVQNVRVTEPASRFAGVPVVGVFAPQHVYSYWRGATGDNATSVNYTLTAQYYKHDRWGDVWLEDGSLEIPAGGAVSVRAVLSVPEDRLTGVYQGALIFKGEEHSATVPVSYAVKTAVEQDVPVTVSGEFGQILYDARSIGGATSLIGTYASGGWRQFYFDVGDSQINIGVARISWDDPGTQITVFAVDPSGRLAGSTANPGAYGELYDSVGSDWLGLGIDGSGGFYPATNINSTSVGLYIPINQTGTWSLLTHSAVYGGDHNAEPVDLSLKFTNLP